MRLFRQFYLAFPELSTSVSRFLLSDNQIWQPVIAKLELPDNESDTIWRSTIAKSTNEELISPEEVFSSLSFTHIAQLLSIKDPVEMKRLSMRFRL